MSTNITSGKKLKKEKNQEKCEIMQKRKWGYSKKVSFPVSIIFLSARWGIC
jgi:hypothetical protein